MRAPIAFVILLVLAFPPLFVLWFVSQERTVYDWDVANYWVIATDLTERFRASPGAAIGHALRSVTTDKYNELAALPLAPVLLLSGTGRVAYAVSVTLLFALPTIGLLALLVRRVTREPAEDGGPVSAALSPALVAVLAAALLPQLWFPIVLGGLDLIGCLPILLIFLLVAAAPSPPEVGRAFAIGLLLGVLPLLRRWYAFFDVTFLATFWALAFLRLFSEVRGAERSRALRRAVRAGLAMLAGGALAALPLAGPVGEAVFLRDHVHLHVPYLTTPGVLGALWRTWTYFGSVVLGLAALGLVAALRERRLRWLALLLAGQAICTVLLFNRVQTLGANHFYLVIPALLFFESHALLRLLQAARGRARAVVAVAMLALLALNFAAVLVPALSASERRTSTLFVALFGKVRHAPLRRADTDEIARLSRAVAAAHGSGRGPVYVLASSTVLNPDTLRNARLSLPHRTDVADLRQTVVPGVHVDRRDGFPEDLLAARVVVTAEPPQLHLAPEEQRVVWLPLQEILAGTTIGRSFRPLPGRFALEDGVTARVFVREDPLDPEDRRAFRRILAPALPETTHAPDAGPIAAAH